MKIKLLKSVAGIEFSYGKGEIVDAPDHIAKDLVKAKLATKTKEDITKEVANLKFPKKETGASVKTMSTDEYADKLKKRKTAK